MSSDVDRPVSATMSVMADEKDDLSKDIRLAVSSVSQLWTSPAAAAVTIKSHDASEHHDYIEKSSVDELRGVYQHDGTQRSICPTAPPLYGRLEFDTSNYDYNYSPQYCNRYMSFQGPPTSSYVGAMAPYAAPYSPSGLNAYAFNLAGPCATGAAYTSSYVSHHLTPPSAALLTSERPASSYRFTSSSASLLQPRTLTTNLCPYIVFSGFVYCYMRPHCDVQEPTVYIGQHKKLSQIDHRFTKLPPTR